MDQPHSASAANPTAPGGNLLAPSRATNSEVAHRTPQDDDERFIVGLVLTYYRRHPQRARARLLELLGEVLAPSAPTPPTPPPRAGKLEPPAPPDDGRALWSRTQAAVAPLKRKR
jgi:hypothetical protein